MLPSNCPSGYVDLSNLVSDQLASIPRDPQSDDTDAETGYKVAKDKSGNIAIKAPNTEIGNVKRTGTVPVGYQIASASYDGDRRITGENVPTGVTFNGDGTKMFVVGYRSNSVYGYSTTEEK